MTPASHREQLNAMLCEAAEIEHTLMCSYLYAAFSLKQTLDEDLSEAELQAVRRWRSEIVAVATDEMLHLVLVNNLIAAIGERPHFRRFNFPISSGLFPADVAVSLAPLDMETLDHFVYLERPRTAEERDAIRYEKGNYRRTLPAGRLMAFADDYATVGELYEGILQSFRDLIEKHGEAAVLVGGRDTQLSRREFALEGLQPVLTLADIEQVIGRIVSQGEGSMESQSGSHYARFCAIRHEWQALAAARPEFKPARAAAYDPVMRTPVVNARRVHIIEEPAATLLDAGNTSYGLMLRLLGVLSDTWLAKAGIRADVAQQTLLLMHITSEIGALLSALSANADMPGINAGLTFTVSRSALSFASPDNACSVLAERFLALAQRIDEQQSHIPSFASAAAKLRRYAEQWRGWRELHEQTALAKPNASAGAPLTAVIASEPPPSNKSGHVEEVAGTDATIRFDHQRCIHARHCVLGEPRVFLANTPGDWICPDASAPADLMRVAIACPSGAISVLPKDEALSEKAPEVNLLRVRENGPLAVHAELSIAGRPDGFRATLCRCGQSKNKPYCDGSHVDAGFIASGEPLTRPSEPLALRNGTLHIEPLQNGPLDVTGNLEVLSGTGRTVERLERVRLCRCGQSKNKPYCDSSHIAAGFVADGS